MSQFPLVPQHYSDHTEWLRVIARTLNLSLDGKTNNTGTVTLAVSPAVSTTVTDRRIGAESAVLLCPETANAAAAIGTTYLSNRDPRNGQFTLTHAASASSDLTFTYVIVG